LPNRNIPLYSITRDNYYRSPPASASCFRRLFGEKRRCAIEYYLGIDLGTSDVKTILLDRQGNARGAASEGYPIIRNTPGMAEQDPSKWWKAVVAAVRWTLKESGTPIKDIAAIGVGGQMHGGVFLDRKLEPIGNAIIWADNRSQAEVREIYDRVGRMRLGKVARSPVATGFLAATLLWLRKHEPGKFKKIHRTLLPKDFIRYKLTGEIGTDVSDASATLLFDTAARNWSREILEALELDSWIFPPCGESTEVCGRLSDEVAGELGLKSGITIVRGGGDTPLAAVGNGVIEPGIVSVNLGSGGQVLAALEEPLYDPDLRTHTFCHAAPDRWYIMGAILSGGLSLQWLRSLTEGRFTFAEFDGLAGEIKPGSEGLLFLPYLNGERTPHMDSDARGAFIGLTARHGAGHMARSVMEGVAFALKDCYDILISIGISPEKVVTGGSGGQSAVWRQIIADVLGVDLHVMASAESSVFGAAIVAAVGVGAFPNVKEACKVLVPKHADITKPKEENAEVYRKTYSIYKSIYPTNSTLFHVIANLTS